MILRWKKREGGVVLSCVRDGAPVALQRTGHGGFFARHDFMHYAVETTLGLRRAFLGLMAAGWAFSTFGDREDPRYRSMPGEALLAERLVDVLLRRVGDPARLDPQLAELWRDELRAEIAGHPQTASLLPVLTPGCIDRICRTFEDLAGRCRAVPVGGHLELEYPGTAPPRGMDLS